MCFFQKDNNPNECLQGLADGKNEIEELLWDRSTPITAQMLPAPEQLPSNGDVEIIESLKQPTPPPPEENAPEIEAEINDVRIQQTRKYARI